MAFTAREVILVFRGQNYLSGAIRRASMDVAGLSRVQQLQLRRTAAMQAATRVAASKAAAEQELRSVQTGGARQLALQRAFDQRLLNMRSIAVQQSENETLTKRREMNLKSRRLERADLITDLRKQRTQISAIEAAMAGGLIPAEKAAEAEKTLAAAKDNEALLTKQVAHKKELVELDKEQVDSARQRGHILQARYIAEDQTEQQLLARKGQLVNTEKRLTEEVKRFELAQGLANLRMKQADALIATANSQRYADMARKVEHVSRVVQMLGLIATATFGYLAQSFAKFQTQMTIAATQSTTLGHNTVAQVQANAATIGKSIQDMLLAGQTIAKPEELGQSIYDIFSGVTLHGNQQAQLRQGIALMKQFNQVVTANAGLVDMNQVTQAGITLMNDFGVSVRQMPKALNTMQASVRFGRMNMEQFLSTFNQAAPAAKGAGYTFTQMATAITFLSQKFPNIRFAGTAYARLVEIIGRSRKEFEQHGIAVQKHNGQLLPLEQILANIAKRYPRVVKGARDLGEVFKEITGTSGTFQARRAGIFLIQDQPGLLRTIKNVTGDTNELTKSLKSAQATAGVSWAEFINQMRGISLVVGEGAVRAFQKLSGPVKAVVNWFRGLSPETQHLIGYFGSLAAVAALVGATLTSIGGGFVALALSTHIFFQLRNAMEDATKKVMALQAQQAELAVTAEAAATSEAGFATVGMGLTLGIAAAIPLIIMYHTQISHAISATTDWGQALVALVGIFAALNIGRVVTSFMALGAVMRGAVLAGGVLVLIAAFKNWDAATDKLRMGMDALMHSWVGYIATLAIATTAVYKLRTAIIALGIASKGAAVGEALIGVGSAIGNIPSAIAVRRAAAQAQRVAAKNFEEGLSATGMFAMTREGRMGKPGGFLFGSGGRRAVLGPGGGADVIGTAATKEEIAAMQRMNQLAAAGGVAITAETGAVTGLSAAMGTLGGAVMSFLPLLLVGGALMGGLYLWKRHLDAVHAAAERARLAHERWIASLRRGFEAASAYGQLGSVYQKLVSARTDLGMNSLDIAAYREARKEADTPKDRLAAQLQLNRLYIERAGTLKQIRSINRDINTRVEDVMKIAQAQDGYNTRLDHTRDRLYRLMQLRDLVTRFGSDRVMTGNLPPAQARQIDALARSLGIMRAHVPDVQLINRLLLGTQSAIDDLTRSSHRLGHAYQTNVRVMLQALQDARLIPGKRVSTIMVEDVAALQARIKRALTVQELKALIGFEVDPEAPTLLKKRWQAWVTQRRNQLHIPVHLDLTPVMQDMNKFRAFMGGLKLGPGFEKFEKLFGLWKEATSIAKAPTTPKAPDGGPTDPKAGRTIQEWINAMVKADKTAERVGSVSAFRAAGRLRADMEKAFKSRPILLQAIEQVISNLEDTQKKATKYSDAYVLREYKNAQRLQKIAKNEKTLAAWKDYYKALEKYQKDASDVQQQAIDAAFGKLDAKVKDSTNKLKEAVSNVQGMFDSFKSANEQWLGTLGQGPWAQSNVIQDILQFGGKMRPIDWVKDITMQVNKFIGTQRKFGTLMREGIPFQLTQQIKALGPEAGGQLMDALLSMTPAQRARFVSEWKRGQRAIENATKADLKRQFHDYSNMFGKSIAAGIVRGVKSATPELDGWIRKLILTMFPSLKGKMGPPANGGNGGGGGGDNANAYTNGGGGKRKMTPQEKEMAGATGWWHEPDVHIHVTSTGHPHDAKKQVKDAAWAYRNSFNRR